jgi:hypothetical protein
MGFCIIGSLGRLVTMDGLGLGLGLGLELGLGIELGLGESPLFTELDLTS